MKHESAYRRALWLLGQSAAKRGYPCTLTLAQYAKLQSIAECFYCCSALPRVHDHLEILGAPRTYGHGLDRMENDKGYTWANVVPCCIGCNTSKGKTLTAAQYLRWQGRLAGMISRDESVVRLTQGLNFRAVRDLAVRYRMGQIYPPLWDWRRSLIRRAEPC